MSTKSTNSKIINLFKNNEKWSADMVKDKPEFFSKLSKQQAPEYLWIGCSDSRLPPNEITGLLPGDLFVHRNVGNVVVHTDFNCLSVMEYAVVVLKIKHIIVCGHYGCGGVQMAMENTEGGLVDNWLRHIRDVYLHHQTELEQISEKDARWHRLCELNVIGQVDNVAQTTVVQSAWKRGQELSVHGWVYGIHDGLLRDLNVSVSSINEAKVIYQKSFPNL